MTMCPSVVCSTTRIINMTCPACAFTCVSPGCKQALLYSEHLPGCLCYILLCRQSLVNVLTLLVCCTLPNAPVFSSSGQNFGAHRAQSPPTHARLHAVRSRTRATVCVLHTATTTPIVMLCCLPCCSLGCMLRQMIRSSDWKQLHQTLIPGPVVQSTWHCVEAAGAPPSQARILNQCRSGRSVNGWTPLPLFPCLVHSPRSGLFCMYACFVRVTLIRQGSNWNLFTCLLEFHHTLKIIVRTLHKVVNRDRLCDTNTVQNRLLQGLRPEYKQSGSPSSRQHHSLSLTPLRGGMSPPPLGQRVHSGFRGATISFPLGSRRATRGRRATLHVSTTTGTTHTSHLGTRVERTPACTYKWSFYRL